MTTPVKIWRVQARLPFRESHSSLAQLSPILSLTSFPLSANPSPNLGSDLVFIFALKVDSSPRQDRQATWPLAHKTSTAPGLEDQISRQDVWIRLLLR